MRGMKGGKPKNVSATINRFLLHRTGQMKILFVLVACWRSLARLGGLRVAPINNNPVSTDRSERKNSNLLTGILVMACITWSLSYAFTCSRKS